MTNQWNPEEIDKISTAFTHKIIEDYFQLSSRISGYEITNLTKIPQINYFVLREIFKRWEEYLADLESPYFDFESEQVKQAITVFKNKLSSFISVDKTHFSELLKNAVRNTILLYQNPEDFFRKDFDKSPDHIVSKEWLGKNKVFFKDYAWLIGSLINNFDKEEVSSIEALSLVRKLLIDNKENHTKELGIILEESGVKATVPVSISEEKTEENDNLSFFERLVSNPPKKYSSYATFDENKESPFERLLSTSSKPQSKADEVQPKVKTESSQTPSSPVSVPDTPRIETKITEEKTTESVEKKTGTVEKKTDTVIKKETPGIGELVEKTISKENKQKSLFDDYRVETLNDKLTPSEAKSLSDKQQKSKIDSLKDNMTLNQRFRYSNNLFGMDLDIFEGALLEVEQQPSFISARDFILNKYAEKFKWETQEEIKDEFIAFIERRFND